jgi:uncharacterized protein
VSAELESRLRLIGPSAVAVSGGVDSMALATLAHRLLGAERIKVIHAASPAVPPEATERVRRYADLENWDLLVVDAGEFADANYLHNPVNRCYFCKTNLYGTIARVTSRQILSGANVDDLGEYRPGLDAAREHKVRHPYIEVGVGKRAVRALAHALGLEDVAELPSSPCLSSRVETRIAIDPAILMAIHAVETLVRRRLAPKTVRCRVRRAGVVIEVDAETLDLASAGTQSGLASEIAALLPPTLAQRPIGFEAYRNGSAFVGPRP